MSNIDKRALREAAEKALPAMKRLLMMPNDELFDEALLNVDGDVDAANAFNLLTGPETVLALLDELEAKDKAWSAQDNHINQQADRIESLEKKNGELGRALGAAEKRNVEQADIIAKQEKWIKDVEATMIAATDRAEAAEKRIADYQELISGLVGVSSSILREVERINNAAAAGKGEAS